jgi:hypothetical protein
MWYVNRGQQQGELGKSDYCLLNEEGARIRRSEERIIVIGGEKKGTVKHKGAKGRKENTKASSFSFHLQTSF